MSLLLETLMKSMFSVTITDDLIVLYAPITECYYHCMVYKVPTIIIAICKFIELWGVKYTVELFNGFTHDFKITTEA